MNDHARHDRSGSKADLATALDHAASVVAPDCDSLLVWHANYFKYHRDRLLKDLELCSRHASSTAPLLEVGSVPLYLTAALSRLGYPVAGVDLLPSRYSNAIDTLNLEVASCDIERDPLPFADASFSTVLLNEVFEHLRIDLIFTMREISRVLRPGGALLLSTPNLLSFRGLRNLLRRGKAAAVCDDIYEEYEKLSTIGHMGHVREYSVAEVTGFLEHFGLKTRKVVYRGDAQGRLEKTLIRLVPKLSPFFTVVCEKAAD